MSRWRNHKNHREIIEEIYYYCKYLLTEQAKDSLLDAIDCMKMAERLEQADAQIITDIFCDEVCSRNKCQEGVRCDYARMTKLLAEKILADIRGEYND